MRALIVDDESNIRKVLKIILSEGDFEVHEASRIEEASVLIKDYVFDMALIDLRLPDGLGVDVLREIKDTTPEAIVLVITAFASAETAIETMKAGAYDYIMKPFNIDEIRIIINNIKDKITLQKRLHELQRFEDTFEGIVGQSEAIKNVFNLIEKIVPFDTNVLITGESGTGKELVSKAIHKRSDRADKPFVAINCASLPAELLESELFGYVRGAFTGAYTSKRGLIEEANKGILFLDEIGEMPLSLQAKFLRFLEERKIRPIGSSKEIDIDIRVIAATNKDLNTLFDSNAFRKDLYYRLVAFEIKLPTLKERSEDIPLLIEHFIKVFSKKFQKNISKIEPSFIDYVRKLDLRGNVRELRNIVEREVILSENGEIKCTPCPASPNHDRIVEDVPEKGMDLKEYLASIEKEMLHKALQKTNGIKTKAAELLGLTFREFRYKLSKYDRQ